MEMSIRLLRLSIPSTSKPTATTFQKVTVLSLAGERCFGCTISFLLCFLFPPSAAEGRAGSDIGLLRVLLQPGRTTRHNSGAKRPALAPICLPVKQLGGVEACFRPRNYHLSDTTDMLSYCSAMKHSLCEIEPREQASFLFQVYFQQLDLEQTQLGISVIEGRQGPIPSSYLVPGPRPKTRPGTGS